MHADAFAVERRADAATPAADPAPSRPAVDRALRIGWDELGSTAPELVLRESDGLPNPDSEVIVLDV